jgi:hypothetical protein
MALEVAAVRLDASDRSGISEIVEGERIASCVGHFVVAAVDVIGQNSVVVLRESVPVSVVSPQQSIRAGARNFGGPEHFRLQLVLGVAGESAVFAALPHRLPASKYCQAL